MRGMTRVLAWLLALVPASPLLADATSVTYLTSSSVYVGAGSLDGVEPGTRFRVGEGAATVVLEAVETSPRRAVCRVVEGSAGTLSVGAVAEYSAAALAPARTAPAAEPLLARSGLHGRVGVRYLLTRDDLNDEAEFEQPALDLRLDAPSLFESAWQFHADVRARRTSRTVGGENLNDDRSRVYRLALGFDPRGPGWRIAAGRQPVPALANVGFLDGVMAAYDRTRWSAGAFAGSEPDRANFGFSSDVRDYGGWWDLRSRPAGQRRWGVTAGAVTSYEDSEINREYVFAHGRYSGKRLFALLTQEIDVNRDWKKDLGESALEATSTFASLRFEASGSVSLLAGYDNRRNVRLFRDRETPATAFDDEFRRGVWLGATVRAGDHLRLGLQGRTYRGGDAGDADSYTASAALTRLTRADFALRLRATRYQNERLEGWLYSGEVSTNLGRRLRIGLLGGLRDDQSPLNPDLDDSVTWYGVDLDLDVGRALWVTLSAERSEGDPEEVTQIYATLAYRF